LLVRLKPRQTYELNNARSAPTVACAAAGVAVAIVLATRRAAPRTFARVMMSPTGMK
jgi:hypothetical protein